VAVGSAVGALAGAIGGGLAGKAVAEHFDPTTEDAHWRIAFRTRSYVPADAGYEDYEAAYRYGWESSLVHIGVSFDDAEPALQRGWGTGPSHGMLAWDRAKHAVRDAWNRVTGEADEHGEHGTEPTGHPAGMIGPAVVAKDKNLH
jgi:hypothetical protein